VSPATAATDASARPEDSHTKGLPAQLPKRFHGSARLDPLRIGRDAGRIGEEVVQHLAGLVGAEVEVALDISARIPEGVPDHIVRTVTENARTLRFEQAGFEAE